MHISFLEDFKKGMMIWHDMTNMVCSAPTLNKLAYKIYIIK